jgi:hypothetical protein
MSLALIHLPTFHRNLSLGRGCNDQTTDLVSRGNSVERALDEGLVCGGAVGNSLMLVIGKSLTALFGIGQRQLHRWLGDLGWTT